MRILADKRLQICGMLLVVCCLMLVACKEGQSEERTVSLPFLVVDLDGDGIERIPLEESNAYFDVDGDGLAERTEWIKPEDGFLLVYDKNESEAITSVLQRHVSFATGGLLKFQNKDSNKDAVYDSQDWPSYQEKRFKNLIIFLARDINEDGVIETKRTSLLPCTFTSFQFGKARKHALLCEGGESYDVYDVSFEYEDSNIVWDKLCFSKNISRNDFDSEHCKKQ